MDIVEFLKAYHEACAEEDNVLFGNDSKPSTYEYVQDEEDWEN